MKVCFFMLNKKRGDYYPRSIQEINWEYEAYKHLNIEIEQHTLIYYKTAYYFYVNQNNFELANDIKFGLEAALKDGSFDRVFVKYNAHVINLLRQKGRKVYKLGNPLLSNKTPLHRDELWLNIN